MMCNIDTAILLSEEEVESNYQRLDSYKIYVCQWNKQENKNEIVKKIFGRISATVSSNEGIFGYADGFNMYIYGVVPHRHRQFAWFDFGSRLCRPPFTICLPHLRRRRTGSSRRSVAIGQREPVTIAPSSWLPFAGSSHPLQL